MSDGRATQGAFEPPSPFHGFELSVAVDAPVYAAGQPVRITVAATNDAARAVEHVHPGWQRVVLSVRDERHRSVASDELHDHVPGRVRHPTTPMADRFLPGTAAAPADVVGPAGRRAAPRVASRG